MDKRKEAANKMYKEIDDEIKENVLDALLWAQDYLMRKEGEGHDFWIQATNDGLVTAGFAKPEWAGDHWGTPCEEASEAVVMAVCEYVNGM